MTELNRLPGGASRATWAVTASGGEGHRPLIVRLNTPGALDDAALLREADLLRAARQAGVPGPEVLASGHPEGRLRDGFIVMERIEGEALPRRILRAPELAGARRVLAHQCGQALARIHGIDPGPMSGLPLEDELSRWTDLLQARLDPHPTLELAVRWLGEHRPEPRTPALLHGDFRNGNLIVGPEGLRAVLDWELAHVGDPREDLAWMTIPTWRFGGAGEVGGFGDLTDLLNGYVEAGGEPVSTPELAWFRVLATLRWALICLHQGDRHLDGSERSVELAAVGRRVAEPEWDLLRMLS